MFNIQRLISNGHLEKDKHLFLVSFNQDPDNLILGESLLEGGTGTGALGRGHWDGGTGMGALNYLFCDGPLIFVLPPFLPQLMQVLYKMKLLTPSCN